MRSSSRSAGVAAVLGALAILVLPVSVVAAQMSSQLDLLHTLYVAVPVDVALALIAVTLVRRTRLDQARQVQPRGVKLGRLARVLAYIGLYAAVTGALALGVYGILRWAQ
jgi:ABC-type transport system involved in cytochrome c biogenesis permease subunit